MPNEDVLIDSTALRKLGGGRSPMWPHRLVKRGVLPKPKPVGGRNYWRRSVVLKALGLEDEEGAEA